MLFGEELALALIVVVVVVLQPLLYSGSGGNFGVLRVSAGGCAGGGGDDELVLVGVLIVQILLLLAGLRLLLLVGVAEQVFVGCAQPAALHNPGASAHTLPTRSLLIVIFFTLHRDLVKVRCHRGTHRAHHVLALLVLRVLSLLI